jgi:hypothetical protein
MARRVTRVAGVALLAVATIAAWTPPAIAARPAGDDRAAREIAGLIRVLGESGCRFARNGRWHDAAQARAHLQRKYDWARKRGMDGTAENFIERAASRSSLSGRPYRVRCPGRPEVDAHDWFSEQLERLRAAGA